VILSFRPSLGRGDSSEGILPRFRRFPPSRGSGWIPLTVTARILSRTGRPPTNEVLPRSMLRGLRPESRTWSGITEQIFRMSRTSSTQKTGPRMSAGTSSGRRARPRPPHAGFGRKSPTTLMPDFR